MAHTIAARVSLWGNGEEESMVLANTMGKTAKVFFFSLQPSSLEMFNYSAYGALASKNLI